LKEPAGSKREEEDASLVPRGGAIVFDVVRPKGDNNKPSDSVVCVGWDVMVFVANCFRGGMDMGELTEEKGVLFLLSGETIASFSVSNKEEREYWNGLDEAVPEVLTVRWEL
jgi:hypothetical protein